MASPYEQTHESKVDAPLHTCEEAYHLITDLAVRGDESVDAVSEVLRETEHAEYIEGVSDEGMLSLTRKIDDELSAFLQNATRSRMLANAGGAEIVQLRTFYNYNNFVVFGQEALGDGDTISEAQLDELLRYRLIVKLLDDMSDMPPIDTARVSGSVYGFERGGAIDPRVHNGFSPDYQNDTKDTPVPHIRGTGGIL